MAVFTSKYGVVGAGPIGSAVARHLAEAGAEVVVIGPADPEGRDVTEAPLSSWSDESRMFHAVDLPMSSALMAKRARSRFEDMQQRSGIAFATPHEALTLVDPADLKAMPDGIESDSHFDLNFFQQNAADAGVRVHQLDTDELRLRYPYLTVSDGFVGLQQPDSLILNPRKFVAAELQLAAQAGAKHIDDWVTGWEDSDRHVSLKLQSGDEWIVDTLVLAAGPNLMLDNMLSRPLESTIIGFTVSLIEVDEGSIDFPALMYRKWSGATPFAGLIVPPLRYPDGKWYIKGVGDTAMRVLTSGDEAREWARAGGDVADAALFAGVLRELVPSIELGAIRTKPGIISLNHEVLPYIGCVSEHVVVATEGDHSVTIGDEVGRLAAQLALTGRWTDSLSERLFMPRYAAVAESGDPTDHIH